ncbi:MAG: peroxiredoxin (alkyl hydroperoxide reductase subunit C), partial [Halieaceae bacterium]
HVVLFFYPKDFTFVCPSELHAFQDNLDEFKSRGVEVIAVSTDTEQSHWGWLQMEKNKGGIQGVTYPVVADTNKTISHNYDVLAGEFYYNDDEQLCAEGDMIAYRGLFLIDKEGLVRHQLVNDLPLGRNVEEALRMVDALQFFEEHGEVCPANWSKGKAGMKATHDGVADYLANN